MEFIKVAILGGLQGLTEFLPISSDGHLLLVRHLLRWQDQGLLFDAILHLGTFFAILLYFRKTWWRLLQVIIRRGTKEDETLLGLLIVATIPGAIIGYFLEDYLEKYFRGVVAAGFGFLLTAALLYFADRIYLKRNGSKQRLNAWQAFVVGCAQAVALLPGVSRSGSTISAGMFAGLSREKAIEFSFLMAAPITAGAGFLALLKNISQGTSSLPALVVGFMFSFFVGLWAIKFLLSLSAKKNSFKTFVIYLVLVALISFLSVNL